MKTFAHLLTAVPFWIWVTLPAILLAGIAYYITHSKTYTICIGVLAFLLAWLTAAFHFWQLYLYNHFLGSFDMYGLPGHLSRSGWYLLIDAWPLWSVPVFVALSVAIIGMLVFYYLHTQSIVENNFVSNTLRTTVSGTSSATMVQQMEIKKLQQQLNVAKQKLREFQQTGQIHHPSANKDELSQARADVLAKKKEIQQLGQQIRLLEDDLARSKSLIERLLNERNSSPPKPYTQNE